jgi:putative transposase
MALAESAPSELLDAFRAGDGLDLIRDAVRLVLQELIELEATDRIGAARYERADTRVTERNGVRARMLSTQASDVSCGSRSCIRVRSSRRFSSHAAVSTRRCMRW